MWAQSTAPLAEATGHSCLAVLCITAVNHQECCGHRHMSMPLRTLDIPDDTQLRPVNTDLLRHHEAALNSCVAAAGVLQPSLPAP